MNSSLHHYRPVPDDRDAHSRFQKTRSWERIAEVKRRLDYVTSIASAPSIPPIETCGEASRGS